MQVFVIINGAPYGDERVFNALRLVMALQANPAKPEVTVCLLGDAVSGALPEQMTPQGYYNIERILKGVLTKKGSVLACSSCLQARGLMEVDLIEGVEPTTMPEIADLVVSADKVLTF
jgi:uncharacterized protein involved in oxidation of intracellular sulfur